MKDTTPRKPAGTPEELEEALKGVQIPTAEFTTHPGVSAGADALLAAAELVELLDLIEEASHCNIEDVNCTFCAWCGNCTYTDVQHKRDCPAAAVLRRYGRRVWIVGDVR